MDLVRDGDDDVADLLRGKAALLDAAKKGNLARVQRLVTPENINCRDSQGRNSTLLHLAGNFAALNCTWLNIDIQVKIKKRFQFLKCSSFHRLCMYYSWIQ